MVDNCLYRRNNRVCYVWLIQRQLRLGEDEMPASSWEHLPRAPIVEALIDIRVTLAPDAGIDRFDGFRDAVSDAYPTCRERHKFQGQLTLSGKEAPVLKADRQGPDGYLLTSADGTQVVQVRLDGFTFSRLKPYQDWAGLRDAARSLWDQYRDESKPKMITRIAVRYLNRLELPLPVSNLKDWILTVPEIAPELPQDLAGFFMRLHVPFAEPKGLVNITQHVEASEDGKHLPLILDIDAFLPMSCDSADESMWDRFEDLRTIKNDVFFSTVTKKAKERYK